jgi:hypothetical protein
MGITCFDLTLGGSIFITVRSTRSSPFHACSSHVESAYGDTSPLSSIHHVGTKARTRGLLIKGHFTVRSLGCSIRSHLALDTTLARPMMLTHVLFWAKISCTHVITERSYPVLLRFTTWVGSFGWASRSHQMEARMFSSGLQLQRSGDRNVQVS